jgi:TonB family protein
VTALSVNVSGSPARTLILFVAAFAILPNVLATGGQQSDNSTKSLRKGSAYSGLEMLTPDGGVDFNSYLQSVYKSIKLKWFAVMPGSVSNGEEGVVIIRFRIQKDGTIPGDSMKFGVPPSGKDELDKAALKAIQTAAPFDNLPDKFTQPFHRYSHDFLLQHRTPQKITRRSELR